MLGLALPTRRKYLTYMPQLHFSVDEETARRLSEEAKRRGLSLSRYLASLVRGTQAGEWPSGYLKRVVGSFRSDPLRVPEDLPLDDVDLREP